MGSAGTGLIFTRSQEGSQPGWLTQTHQTDGVFDNMWCHTRFGVGELAWARLILAWERAGLWVVR